MFKQWGNKKNTGNKNANIKVNVGARRMTLSDALIDRVEGDNRDVGRRVLDNTDTVTHCQTFACPNTLTLYEQLCGSLCTRCANETKIDITFIILKK